MRTSRELYPQPQKMYTCELEGCPVCSKPLGLSKYWSGHKIVQTLSSTMEIGYGRRQWLGDQWSMTARKHFPFPQNGIQPWTLPSKKLLSPLLPQP